MRVIPQCLRPWLCYLALQRLTIRGLIAHRWLLVCRLLRHTQRSHRQIHPHRTHPLVIRSAASCNTAGGHGTTTARSGRGRAGLG
jgi:hypothetical protein